MLKILAGSIREYKKDSILTPILVSLEVIMEVIIPLLMARLIDYGIDCGDMAYILKIGFILLITAMMSLFLEWRQEKRQLVHLQDLLVI